MIEKPSYCARKWHVHLRGWHYYCSTDHMANICNKLGKNLTGLSRWCWISINSEYRKKTRIVSVYQPFRSSKRLHVSTYDQHRQYFIQRGNSCCLHLILRTNFEAELRNWVAQGNCIIVYIDTNENLKKGNLQSIFACLKMHDIISKRVHLIQHNILYQHPATWFRGWFQIGGVSLL